jgi:hypothetical protein
MEDNTNNTDKKPEAVEEAAIVVAVPEVVAAEAAPETVVEEKAFVVEDVAEGDIASDEEVVDLTASVGDEEPLIKLVIDGDEEVAGGDGEPDADVVEVEDDGTHDDLTATAVDKSDERDVVPDEDTDGVEGKKDGSDLGEKHEIDFSDDVTALVSGEPTLSEGFKAKAASILEAAVTSRTAAEKKRLKEEFQTKLDESKAAYKETLVEKIDAYLTTVIEGWMEENKVALEAGLRTEIAENFMGSLKNLFNEHYIEVPQAKTDISEKFKQEAADLKKKTVELEESLATEKKKTIAAIAQAGKLAREKIIAEACKSLTSLEASKLVALTEDVAFTDVANFTKKIETLKESYFRQDGNLTVKPLIENLTADTSKEKTMAERVADSLNHQL